LRGVHAVLERRHAGVADTLHVQLPDRVHRDSLPRPTEARLRQSRRERVRLVCIKLSGGSELAEVQHGRLRAARLPGRLSGVAMQLFGCVSSGPRGGQ
jgi:hypothetical protein